MSSRLRERPCAKEQGEEQLKETLRVGLCLHIHMCIYENLYSREREIGDRDRQRQKQTDLALGLDTRNPWLLRISQGAIPRKTG